MRYSATTLRWGPPQENKFIGRERLGSGLSVKAVVVFLLFPSGLGFRVVESLFPHPHPMYTRRYQVIISKMMWGATGVGGGTALKLQEDLGLFRHQGGGPALGRR